MSRTQTNIDILIKNVNRSKTEFLTRCSLEKNNNYLLNGQSSALSTRDFNWAIKMYHDFFQRLKLEVKNNSIPILQRYKIAVSC